jgi:hypothetical protein
MEAEFMAACNTAKMILFVRSVLWDLNIPQEAATMLYEDNDGCTAMGNAQKSTPCTRHIDIKYFLICKWVERDLVLLDRIDTSINMSDHLTKALQPLLFHCHADFLLGHIPPMYSPVYQTTVGHITNYKVTMIYLFHSLSSPHLQRRLLEYTLQLQAIIFTVHTCVY